MHPPDACREDTVSDPHGSLPVDPDPTGGGSDPPVDDDPIPLEPMLE